MDQNFKSRKRLRFRCVNDWETRAVPAPSKDPSALPKECRFCVLPFYNAPSADAHEKTPCSKRPIKFSISREPSSVREY